MADASCSSCGVPNPPESRFCGSCGEALRSAAACPDCAAPVEAGQRFCGGCGRPLEAAPAADPRNVIDGGRYHVLRFLGEGSRKVAYQARDQELGRLVAVSLLKTEGLSASGLESVREEARTLARVGEHPNVVRLFDAGEQGGRPFLVTEFMEGGDLSDLLARQPGRRLELDRLLGIGIGVTTGLAHAHGRKVVHRDLKPANVWLTEDGVAKLADFGLATAVEHARFQSDGTVLGTVDYMPPEQALGRGADARSDLYSLGVILYEMATGRAPFTGEDAVAVISQHVNAPPVAPTWYNPALPKSLEALILGLLSKAPEDRPQSATEVVAALEAIRSGAAPQAATRARNPLDPLSTMPFVGRRDEMSQLKRALDDAFGGGGRVVLLAGDPGVGKTRTTQEISTYAQLRGAEVLLGRCYEGEGAPSFWPWVQVLRAWAEERDPATLLSDMGPGAPDIGQVVPELRRKLPELEAPPALEVAHARFRFFDSVSKLLESSARRRPLVLVLDDLHWADKPSVLLLEFLAREIQGSPILLVGTYREIELGPGTPLAAVLPNLRREPVFERIALRGIGVDDLRQLLGELSGQHVPEAFVRAIFSETEGNPFFVLELLRHLVEEGQLYVADGRWTSDVALEQLGIPDGVREVIGRRLSRLGDRCRKLLTIASAIGREFDAVALERLAEGGQDQVLDAIAEAEEARVLQPMAQRGRYRFSHALIREVLYEGLGSARRTAVHRRVAHVLESLYADDLDPYLSELAHHYHEAAAAGEVDKAIDYAVRAARRSSRVLAWEDASLQYERALDAVALVTPVDEPRRCDLLLACGEAHIRSGDAERAREVFLSAGDLARKLGCAERLARAALGVADFHLRSMGIPTGVIDDLRIERLSEALAALGHTDAKLRALLLSQYALALYYRDTPERRGALCDEAVALARQLGDPATLAATLQARHSATWGPDTVEQRLADASAIVELAEELGDKELALLGHTCRQRDLLEKGDMNAVDHERGMANRLAETLRQPLYLWAAPLQEGGRALLDGRYADAERLIGQCFALGQRLKAVQAGEAYAAQLATLRRETGNMEALLPAFESIVQRFPGLPAWRCALANACVVANRLDRAREIYDDLEKHDFETLPRDAFWLLGMCLIAEVGSVLGERRGAERLLALLEPYARLYVVMGMWAGAVYGSTSHYLGLVCTTLGRFGQAVACFEEALKSHQQLGSRPLVAHTQYAFGRMLLACDEERDRPRAFDLLSSAVDTAQALGMKVLVERALPLKLELQGIDATTDTQSSILAVGSAVQRAQPDLRSHAARDGTVTLLFSDVEGFTRMTERLGDLRSREVMERHHRIVRDQLARHGGHEVELLGDGFLLAFASARQAARCAVAIQCALAAYNDERPDEPIRVRMGLHTGEVLRDADRFFGRTVIQASRIADQARGGEILISSLLRELLGSAGDMRFGEPRTVSLKGLSGEYQLFPLDWAS